MGVFLAGAFLETVMAGVRVSPEKLAQHMSKTTIIGLSNGKFDLLWQDVFAKKPH